MKDKWRSIPFFFLLLAAAPVLAQSGDCAGLKAARLQNTVIAKTEATPVGTSASDARPGQPPAAPWNYPAYCLVQGTIDGRTGADGKPYGIQFEMRLPEGWNGKLLYQGGGGTDGVVRPAAGSSSLGAMPGLARGYAVISTDGGHQGAGDTSFGKEQQARLDYAYNWIGEAVRTAKQLVAIYYGHAPAKSYFAGCSNGGREAMIAVERYPTEFDGAVAGDPGFRLSRAAIAQAWDTGAFNAAAPLDPSGHPSLKDAFSDADLKLVSDAVLAACDQLDGLKDGQINNVAACRFDPAILTCKDEKNASCLSRAQVEALHKIFAGAHDSKGNELYAGWPYDAGISDPGWRGWKLGSATVPARSVTLGANSLRDYFVSPFDPSFDPAKVDFDTAAEKVAATAEINDATDTQLSTFAAKGGKLIIYEGVSDPVFSANDIISYYQRLEADNGGEAAQGFARLFLIPGMTHCGGGPSTDEFDALTALENWAEKGSAPERIVAHGKAFPGRTRPLCAFPKYAAYDAGKNPEDADSFTCKLRTRNSNRALRN